VAEPRAPFIRRVPIVKPRTLLALFTALLPAFSQEQAEWQNPVRKLLRDGGPVIGAAITVASADAAA
jgi:hypothetical protein